MPKQLTDVDIEFISLVKRGANGQPITIYKSADYTEEPAVAQETTQEKGLSQFFKVLKDFFTGGEVTKAQDLTTHVDWASFNSMIGSQSRNISEACDMLSSAIWEIFWDNRIVNGKERILQNIEEFRVYVSGILGTDPQVQKDFFTTNKGGENNVTKEEIIALLEPITKSVSDLTEKVEALAKVEEQEAKVQEVAKATEEVAKATEEVAKAGEEGRIELVGILTGIQKSLDQINQRVTAIEEYRGGSNQTGEPKEISKELDSEEAFWATGGIL